MIRGDKGIFEQEIDRFFANLYGLDAADLEVIGTASLTLAKRTGSHPGSGRVLHRRWRSAGPRFIERLRELIAPLLEVDPDDLPATLWFPPGSLQANETFGEVLGWNRLA